MSKKFIVSWVAAFVVWMIGSFAIHGAWLAETYAVMTNIMRPEEEQMGLFHFMLLAHVVLAAAFVWIYQRGTEDKPWLAQGVRFGIAIALVSVIPMFTIFYVVQQTPGDLAVRQIIGETILLVAVGIVTAFLNRSDASA
jgi:hypothetical protein